MRNRLIICALVTLASAASVSGCNGPRYRNGEDQTVAVESMAVRVEVPRPADEVSFSAPLSGTVQAAGQVQIGFQISGEVSRVLVEEGQEVIAGQLLATLDDSMYSAQHTQALGSNQQAAAQLEMLQNGSRPEEVATAEAALASAEAVNRQLTRDHERFELLFRQGVISRSELDASLSGLQQSQESVETARQQLQLARQGPRTEQIEQAKGALTASNGSLQMAKVQLEHARLVSPINGTVVQRALEIGQVVMAGQQVLEIADLNSLEIITEIPEGDLSRIAVGDVAEVSFPAIPGSSGSAKVISIAPKAGQMTRAFPVTLQLTEPESEVVPGMVALVSLGFQQNPGGFVIRENAIVDGHVYVVRDGRASRVAIEIVGDRGGNVFVTGVDQTDQVIVNGQHRVSEGDAVNIVDALGISEITRLEAN